MTTTWLIFCSWSSPRAAPAPPAAANATTPPASASSAARAKLLRTKLIRYPSPWSPPGNCRGNYGTEIERGLSELRVVRPELLAERVADLADRAAGPERLPHRDEEVLLAGRD